MADNQRRRTSSARDGREVRQTQPNRPPAQRRQQKSSRAQRRKNNSGVLLRVIIMLVVVAVFIMGIAIFFKVTEVQVSGNALYSAEEVVAASGIELGDNLMTLSKSVAGSKLQIELPYVESVYITRILPGTIVITVQETEAAYLIDADDGASWLINSNGKLLEQAATTAASYPVIVGVTALSPAVSTPVVTEQEDSLAAAKLILHALEETALISQISEINVEKTYDIIVKYGTQYEIRLGGTDEMSYKIEYLTKIVDSLDGKQGGEIDLTLKDDRSAIFKPW